MTQLLLQWLDSNDIRIGKIALATGIVWLLLEWWALAVK
jgi:hypothetical protein